MMELHNISCHQHPDSKRNSSMGASVIGLKLLIVYFINSKKNFNSLSFWERLIRIVLVSLPWIVFASAQRRLPRDVTGPVDLPPWNIQTRFPLEAAFLHCCLLRFDRAWHLKAWIRPPASKIYFPLVFDCILKLIHSTSWIGSPVLAKVATCFFKITKYRKNLND